MQNQSAIAPIVSSFTPSEERRLLKSTRELENLTPQQRMQFIMNEHTKSIRGEGSSFFGSLYSSTGADEDDLDFFEDAHFTRRLQTDQTFRQHITFDSCLFENSERGNTGAPIEQFGVITTEGVADDLVIKNSVFLATNLEILSMWYVLSFDCEFAHLWCCSRTC